jgi:GTPase KRas
MCVIDDEVAVLDVLDTAGQEEYSAMREQYMRVGEGFMLVYSITSRHSFQEIETFQKQILRIKDKEYFPMMVVGHNCHMEDKREVSFKEGKNLALHMGCGFIEASSESHINVDNAFYDLVRDIRKYEKRKSEASVQRVKQISRRRQRRKHWFRGIGITPSLEVINESGNLPYEDSTS